MTQLQLRVLDILNLLPVLTNSLQSPILPFPVAVKLREIQGDNVISILSSTLPYITNLTTYFLTHPPTDLSVGLNVIHQVCFSLLLFAKVAKVVLSMMYVNCHVLVYNSV